MTTLETLRPSPSTRKFISTRNEILMNSIIMVLKFHFSTLFNFFFDHAVLFCFIVYFFYLLYLYVLKESDHIYVY